jgi:chromosome segregation ATPase
MDQNHQNHQNPPETFPNDSAEFGNVRKGSEGFRNIPHLSETFGTIPNASEAFRNVPKFSERKENHTLTVRDAARMFEAAGVARTERSIVNWCQPNRTGIARLDSYFDPNERKYYLTTESVERAIQEEIQKATKINEPSEPVGSVPKASETPKSPSDASEADTGQIRELEKEVLDWKILNKGKDFFIEQLQKERDAILGQLVQSSRKMGELETRLLQLEGPKETPPHPTEL